MHVRLWDFGTLKSHSLKVSVQIFIQAAWHAGQWTKEETRH